MTHLREGKTLQKKPEFRSKTYLDYIRSLPCSVAECMDPAQAHHIKAGGVGLKCDDTLTIPLCGYHHGEIEHNEQHFLRFNGLALYELVAGCLINFLATKAAEIRPGMKPWQIVAEVMNQAVKEDLKR